MNEKETKEYHDWIEIGELASKALREPLAKHLQKSANQQLKEIMREFQVSDPHDYRAMTDLQVRVRSIFMGIELLQAAAVDGAIKGTEYFDRLAMEKEQQEDNS